MLKTLDQYEREKIEAGYPTFKPMGTGVACPQCGEELMDEGNSLVSVLPQRKRFTCPKPECRFSKVVLA